MDEVPAVGRAAVGVRRGVVDVAAARSSPAAGPAAVSVAHADEPLLGCRRPVRAGRTGRTEARAVVPGSGRIRRSLLCRRTAADPFPPSTRAAAELAPGPDGDEPPGGRVADGDLDGATGRRGLDAQHVQLL